MAKAKDFEFEKPIASVADEDEATLAAIDEGIRDARPDEPFPWTKFANS